MADTSTFVNRRWRFTQSAPRRWMLFFIVVWSIAGAFVALNSALVRIPTFLPGMGEALSISVPSWIYGAAPVDHCKEALEQWGRSHSTRNLNPEVLKSSREIAWRMGFEVGRVAAPLAVGRSTVADTQRYLEPARKLAAFLQAPAPSLPKVNETIRAFAEFGEFVENDPQCIAAHLAQNFSPQHAHLFKFGEVLGFSTVCRMLLPEAGTVMGLRIAHYGKLAELPESMWIGMARDTKTPLPGSDVNARFNGVIQPFHEYFSCQRENGKSCSGTVGRK